MLLLALDLSLLLWQVRQRQAMQLSGRFGPGLDTLHRQLAGYKRAIAKAAGKASGRPLQEWRKLLSVALARYTILSAAGHQALRGK